MLFADLSVQELAAILANLGSAQNEMQHKIEGCVRKRLVDEGLAEDERERKPLDWQTEEMLNWEICFLLAKNLKAGDRNMPLLSDQDVERIVIKYWEKEGTTDIDSSVTTELMKAVWGPIIRSLRQQAEKAMPPGVSEYDYHEETVQIILDGAQQAGVHPEEFSSKTESWEFVLRRRYSREEYMASAYRVYNAGITATQMRDEMLGPLVALMGEEDFVEADMVKAAIEEQMPQIERIVAVRNQVMRELIEEQTNKLYPQMVPRGAS